MYPGYAPGGRREINAIIRTSFRLLKTGALDLSKFFPSFADLEAERTRIDKVRKLLDDLVRRGPSAYQAFLQVLNETGYTFLADKIIQSEEILRREKDPGTSMPIQATSDQNTHFSSSSRFSPSVGTFQQKENSVLHFNADSSPNVPNSVPSHSVSEPGLLSKAGGLTISERNAESVPSTPMDTDSIDDDLDLESGLSLGTSMETGEDHINTSEEEQLLRDNGPEETIRESQAQHPSDVNHEQYTMYYPSASMTMCSPYLSSFSLKKCYKMDTKPRGLALIINNKQFRGNAYYNVREGSEIDCRCLKELFNSLGFTVVVKEDLETEEMLKQLEEFAKNPQLDVVDCMAVGILSHGSDQEIICGVDGFGVKVTEDILPMFFAKKCPMLQAKPKMFIINACRGGKEGQRISIKPQQIRIGGTRVKTDKLQTDGGDNMSTNIKPQVNDMQDILLSSSTFPGYASYRDTVEGSWFIQELVGVFREQSDTEHVMDMLTEVNHRVSQKHTEMCAQMPFPSNSLTNRWYLNPPQNCQLVI